MRTNIISAALGSTAVISMTMACAGQARAEVAIAEAASAEAEGLGEIIVSAQKRDTNLQQTPISISVLGGEDLKNRSVHSLADLMDGSVPSLRIAPFFSRSSALTVGIRGIVPFDANQPSRDAGVGVYINGVYLGRSQGLGSALFDVERIEVLKGPQGTLFGRNTTGGAVSIVTRKPSGEFHLTQTGGISNFGGYRTETHLDLPRFGNISVKLDGIIDKRGGTVDNPLGGEEDFNQHDRQGLHLQALWEPTDNFSADYSFDISRDATTPYYLQLLDKNPAAPALAPLVQVQSGRASMADVGVPLQESIGKTQGHMLHLNWSPSSKIELRSITAYRKVDQTQWDNGGAHAIRFAPNGLFSRYSLAGLTQDQFSQELQLLGTFQNFNFVAGLYYYHEKGDDWAWTPNTMQWNADGTVASRLPTLQAGQQTPYPDRASDAVADSFAVFGQATWTPPVLNNALHLTAGARFTHDKKHGDLFKVNGVDTPYSFRTSSSRVDPSFTLAFDAMDNVHLYAKWGTAYRAGGANSRSVNYRSFKPEKVETAEIGLKSEWFDKHVRLNLAAYSTRYTDMQVDFSALNLEGSNRGTLETVNVPGVTKIKGIEADATVVIIDGLTVSASYAYTDFKARQAANPFKGGALENVFLVYTPENAVSGSIDYEVPFNGFTLRAHLDANAADGYHAMSAEPLLSDSSFIVNGRLSFADIDLKGAATLQLSAWARNLFDEEHVFVKTSTSAASLGSTGIFNEPRTYGVDATIKF